MALNSYIENPVLSPRAINESESSLSLNESQQRLLQCANSEAFAEVTFKSSQFCLDFIYHFFGYFSLPLMLYFEGWWGCRNRYFIFHKGMMKSENYIPIFLFQVLYTVCHVGSTILYFFTDGINIYEMLFFQLFYALRCAVIAAKYSYFPSVLLENLRKGPETGKSHANHQILAGWVNPSSSLLWQELVNAGVRKKVDLVNAHIIFYGTLNDAKIIMSLATAARKKRDLGPVIITPLGPNEQSLIVQDPSSSSANSSAGSMVSNVQGMNSLSKLGTPASEISNDDSSIELGLILEPLPDSPPQNDSEAPASTPTNLKGFDPDSRFHFKISLLDFLFQVLLDAKKSCSQHNYRLLMATASVSALTVSLTPFVYRLFLGVDFSDWKLLFILFSFAWIEWLSISNNIQFIVGGLNDYWRRYYVHHSLSSLFSGAGFTRSYTQGDFEYNPGEHEPAIHYELTYPANISYWTLFQDITHNFGIIFFNRIQFFTGQFALLIFAAIIFLVYNAFFKNSIHWIALIQMMILFPIFGIYLGLCLFPAAKTNKLFAKDFALVTRAQLMLRTMSSINFLTGFQEKSKSQSNSGLSARQIRQLSICDRLLDAVSRYVTSTEAANPVTLLGVKASTNLAQSLLSLVAGGFFIILRQMYFSSPVSPP